MTTGGPKLDAYVRDLRAILQRYKDASPSFDFSVVDTKNDEEKRTAAKTAGMVETEYVVDGKVVRAFMGLVLKDGSERETLKLMSPEMTTGLEFWITMKVLELHARVEETRHRIGVLTGHDEIKLSDPNLVGASTGQSPTVKEIFLKYFPYYVLVDVDLRKTPGAPVDDGLEGLIVTQPATDLTEDELRRIDAFVLKGKTLTVAASAVNVAAADPIMRATLATHGIEKLLAGYGIEMRRDVLEDFGRSFSVHVRVASAKEPVKMRFPALLAADDDERFTGDSTLLDTTFAAFFRIPQLPFPFASSLVLHRERQPAVPQHGFRIVARSSAETARESEPSVDLAPTRKWVVPGQLAQYDIAATVEGKLQSAFAAASPGARTASAGVRHARVLVLSSSQFFANPFARAGNARGGTAIVGATSYNEALESLAKEYSQNVLTSTILVMKNTLDWMTTDHELAACAALHHQGR